MAAGTSATLRRKSLKTSITSANVSTSSTLRLHHPDAILDGSHIRLTTQRVVDEGKQLLDHLVLLRENLVLLADHDGLASHVEVEELPLVADPRPLPNVRVVLLLSVACRDTSLDIRRRDADLEGGHSDGVDRVVNDGVRPQVVDEVKVVRGQVQTHTAILPAHRASLTDGPKASGSGHLLTEGEPRRVEPVEVADSDRHLGEVCRRLDATCVLQRRSDRLLDESRDALGDGAVRPLNVGRGGGSDNCERCVAQQFVYLVRGLVKDGVNLDDAQSYRLSGTDVVPTHLSSAADDG